MLKAALPFALLLVACTLAAAPAVASSAPAADTASTDSSPADEETFWDRLHDPQDGAFDLSRFLLEHHGFLLIPIFVTEPAVGNGGGAAVVFFQRADQSQESKDRGQYIEPDMYGAGAMRTSNGSDAGAAFGRLHFDDDAWRYTGALAKASINIAFYRSGPLPGDHRIETNLDALLSYQEVSRRLGLSDWYLSARWIYADVDSRLNIASDEQYFQPRQFDKRSSGLGSSLEYDTRDNTLSPSSGVLVKGIATFYVPGIGSDDAYQTYRAYSLGYVPLGDRFELALRGDWRSARGDVPFYQLPYIDLRGIPVMRYQGQETAVAEAELRWKATPRWTLLGFGGAGRAWGNGTAFGEATTRTTHGIGVRYEIARALGLDVGLDYAWGPEDHAFYIQVGSAWR
jgi:hypothetical protein